MERASGARATSSVGFTMRGGGRTSRNYVIGDDGQGIPTHTPVTSASQIWAALLELMGTVHSTAGNPGLRRTLPLADPYFPWCFCEGVGNIAGGGTPQAVAANPIGILEAPTVDNTLLYPSYEFSNVTFTPRPYALLADVDIPTGTLTYADQLGNESDFDYAQEWLRFTDVETVPGGEYITAEAGNVIFDVASGLAPHGIAAGPGQVRMFIPKKAIRMTWFHVPYDYIEHADSFIVQGIGTINQYDWWIYPKGSMLLEGVVVNRYTPIVPSVLDWAGTGFAFAAEKFCDITFVFSFFDPELGTDFSGATATPTAPPAPPTSPGPIQVVQAGHNLVPWAHRMGFYYVRTNITGNTGANNRPLYPSFPFQLLFSNPGVDA